MPEIVRNALKFIFIRKMRDKSSRRQTGSSGVLWPTFAQIEFGIAESEKRVAAILLLPVWPLSPRGTLFCLFVPCIVAVSYVDG